MKTRTAFVANSSSSSFIVKLQDVSSSQLEKIHKHIELAEELYEHKFSNSDRWNIELKNDSIVMTTDMDNFDMEEYLIKIGIPENKIEWDGSY